MTTGKVIALIKAVGGGATGAPATASTVAEMTDTSKIYIYTGNEPGYTAGNWYYWDGTAWVSGGAYGGYELVAESDGAGTTTITIGG